MLEKNKIVMAHVALGTIRAVSIFVAVSLFMMRFAELGPASELSWWSIFSVAAVGVALFIIDGLVIAKSV